MTGQQPMFRFHSLLTWVLLAGIIIMADAWTKQWAVDTLVLYRPLEVNGWLNWTLAYNYGAAFSFLNDAGGWQRWFFIVLAVGVTGFLLVWLFRLHRSEWRVGLALGLVIGGAIGNLIDRISLGYVVDFIDVHYAGHHWPAFNIADSAITCGIALLLLDTLLVSMKKPGDKSTGEQV